MEVDLEYKKCIKENVFSNMSYEKCLLFRIEDKGLDQAWSSLSKLICRQNFHENFHKHVRKTEITKESCSLYHYECHRVMHYVSSIISIDAKSRFRINIKCVLPTWVPIIGIGRVIDIFG